MSETDSNSVRRLYMVVVYQWYTQAAISGLKILGSFLPSAGFVLKLYRKIFLPMVRKRLPA